MTTALSGISSMATRQVLAELCEIHAARGGTPVQMESVGGVEAARRVQAGEAFDLVVLGADAIDRLIASGHLRAGSRVDIVRSPLAACVPAGVALPDLTTEAGVRRALAEAPRVGFSTGPSGVALQQLFQRWGIDAALAAKTVQAPPGVPVASLVARGEVALGFQQLSELLHVPGITVLRELAEPLRILTTFSAAVPVGTPHERGVAEWLAFVTSPGADAAKRRQGMEPA